MASPKDLRAQRANVIAESRKILDKAEAENRDLHADEQAAWDKANAEITNLGLRIERIEKQETLEKQLNAVVDPHKLGVAGGSAVGAPPADDDRLPENEAQAVAIQGWFLRNSGNPKARAQYRKNQARFKQAARQTRIFAKSDELKIPLPGRGDMSYYDRLRSNMRLAWDSKSGRYVNAAIHPLSTQVGTAGGFLIPEGFVGRFETALLAYGYMLQVAEVMRTETAAPLPWPTANDTTNKGRRLNQSEAVDNAGANTAYPTFGAVMFYAYKYTSDEVLVPFELARDNAVGLVMWLGEALGIRIGRVINDDFTTGTATAQPNGIVTAATTGKTAASSTAIKFDEVIDLEYSVDPAYRFSGEGVGYMAHDGIVQYLRKLKDGEGRYLWQPSQQGGEPDRINGYPFTRNQSMQSTVATGKTTILFGALRKYKVRQVGDLRMYRLVERYRDNDQDAFLAFQEFDGNLLDAGTHPVKALVQP